MPSCVFLAVGPFSSEERAAPFRRVTSPEALRHDSIGRGQGRKGDVGMVRLARLALVQVEPVGTFLLSAATRTFLHFITFPETTSRRHHG